MSYVYALNPEHHGCQMIGGNDFEKNFNEIEIIVKDKPITAFEEEI